MSFDFSQFCLDQNIGSATEGHKHCQPGWIQVACPFCTGNPGYHLGYNESDDYFNCWRCGFHGHIDVIKSLTRFTTQGAIDFLREYKARPKYKRDESKRKIKTHVTKLPVGTYSLTEQHIKYLKKRKFDVDKLIKTWNLGGTGPIGQYKFRIIAPIYYRHTLVSYQGRDITDRSELKYKACPKKLESRHHKDCLYGFDYADGNDSIVICEGITDVWRLGPGAVATFGIKYKLSQVNLLKRFKNKFILFDSEDAQAIEQSNKLANQLSAFPGLVEIIELDYADPAEMPQNKAKKLMRKLKVGVRV